MELPILLKNNLNNLVLNKSINYLQLKSKTISDVYSNKELEKSIIINDEDDALVYSLARMPATFAAIYKTLEKTFEIFNPKICSILDIGSGTGTTAWSYYALKHNLPKTTLIEKNKHMISIGEKLFSDTCLKDKICYIKNDYLNIEKFDNADLIVAAYTINEIPQKDMQNLIKKLFFAANQLLILVEPGTPQGYQELMNIKDEILSLGGHIVAPCVTDKCPLQNDWCNFSVRVARDKIHKHLKSGQAPFEDEKYFYLAVSKSDINLKESYRVTRHPLLGGNFITLNCCTNQGISAIQVTKSSNAKFKIAKKIKCGDLFDNHL